MQAWASQIGNIVFIVAAILGAVFFTILLVTGNTMAQAVRERTGELGVLKAIGFTNGQVVALVLAESCLLTVLGEPWGWAGVGHHFAHGDPTGGLLPLVLSSHARFADRIGHQRRAGVGHRNFSRAPGHAPAPCAVGMRVAPTP
jgi:predicted lysophospholipase L1 biosynthesis ABC-type transport system permease subunit